MPHLDELQLRMRFSHWVLTRLLPANIIANQYMDCSAARYGLHGRGVAFPGCRNEQRELHPPDRAPGTGELRAEGALRATQLHRQKLQLRARVSFGHRCVGLEKRPSPRCEGIVAWALLPASMRPALRPRVTHARWTAHTHTHTRCTSCTRRGRTSRIA